MIFYHICYPFSILLSIPLYLCMYITECVRLYASYNASSYSIPILSISDTTSFSLFSPLFSLSLCLFLFIFSLPLFHLSLFIYFYSFLSLSFFLQDYSVCQATITSSHSLKPDLNRLGLQIRDCT